MLAVLEKRGGINLGMSDAYVNVIGGLQLDEPAADLALVLAAASSFRDKPIDPATAAIGEVGLTGEIRAVTGLQQRRHCPRRPVQALRPALSRATVPAILQRPTAWNCCVCATSAKQSNWFCLKSEKENRYGSA